MSSNIFSIIANRVKSDFVQMCSNWENLIIEEREREREESKKVDFEFHARLVRNRRIVAPRRLSIFPQIYRAKLIQIAAPQNSDASLHHRLQLYHWYYFHRTVKMPPLLPLERSGGGRTHSILFTTREQRRSHPGADKSVQQPRAYPHTHTQPPLYAQNVGQPRRIGAQTGWVTTTTGYKVQGETSIR